MPELIPVIYEGAWIILFVGLSLIYIPLAAIYLSIHTLTSDKREYKLEVDDADTSSD